jgi:hypothetical protein
LSGLASIVESQIATYPTLATNKRKRISRDGTSLQAPLTASALLESTIHAGSEQGGFEPAQPGYFHIGWGGNVGFVTKNEYDVNALVDAPDFQHEPLGFEDTHIQDPFVALDAMLGSQSGAAPPAFMHGDLSFSWPGVVDQSQSVTTSP